MELTKETIFSILRMVFGMFAGWLVSQGWMSTEDTIEFIAAAVTVIGTIVWIVVKNKTQQQTVNVALALPIGSGAVELKQEMASPSPTLPPIEKQVK